MGKRAYPEHADQRRVPDEIEKAVRRFQSDEFAFGWLGAGAGLPIRPDVASYATEFGPFREGTTTKFHALPTPGVELNPENGGLEISFVRSQWTLSLAIPCGGIVLYTKEFPPADRRANSKAQRSYVQGTLRERFGLEGELDVLFDWLTERNVEKTRNSFRPWARPGPVVPADIRLEDLQREDD